MPQEEPDDSSSVITLTRFTATDDSTLTKEFFLGTDGVIKKRSHAQFNEGVAKKVTLKKGLKSLPQLIDDLETIECLSTGSFDIPKCKVIPREAKTDSEGVLAIRHRTKEAMQQPSPGLVLFDHDPSPLMPERIKCGTPSALMAQLTTAVPTLKGLGWVGRGSSSQGVFNKKTQEPYPDSGGLHVFIALNTSDLDTLKEHLEISCWLGDLGYVELASNGRRLLRTAIDLSVLSPERLIFEAPPILRAGIGREPQPWDQHEGGLLDIQNIDVSERERREVQERQRAALEDREVVEQAEARYETYRHDVASKTAEMQGVSKQAVLEQIPRYQDADIEKRTVCLPPGHPLQIKGDWYTVEEAFKRAAEFDGQSMPDPIEGVEYGTSTAKLYANDGSPIIHSWAHGDSTSYLLKSNSSPKEPQDNAVVTQSDPPHPKEVEVHGRSLSVPIHSEGFPHLQGTGECLRPKPTYENYCHLLDAYGITVRYDVIGKELQINIPGMKGSVDNRLASSITRIESLAALNGLSTTNCAKYLNLIADEQQFNPIANWIHSIPWDGHDRLPAFYATLTARDGYTESLKVALIYRWLLSAVAAALKASGFQCRGVLTLQGAQGLGKTSWILNLVSHPSLRELYVLAGHHLDPSIKDTVLIAIKHWIVELGELDSSFKKDIARIKGVITNKADKVRKPYAAAASEFQRRTVFAASVNEENFLVDPTGNSRWWVIPLVKIDYQHGIDMQQVFAQLALDYEAGEQWWLTRDEDELLKSHNRWYEAVSVIEEQLLQALDEDLPEDKWPRLTASEVLRHLGYSKPTNPQARECGTVLRRHFGPPKKIKGIQKWQIPLRPDCPNVNESF